MEIMKTWTAPSPEGENITYEIYDEQARNDIATLKNDVANKEASGTAETKVSNHNTDTEAHNDIRLLLTELITQVNSFLDVDDTTRDQLSEILRDIDANKTSIESIISGKVNVTDIINNLTTNVTNKPLSAAQGVALKGLIDALQTALNNHIADGTAHITAAERTAWNNKQPAGNYATKEELPTKTSQLTDDVGFAKQEEVDSLSEEIDDLKNANYVKTVNGIEADENGNVTVIAQAEQPTFVDSVEEMIDTTKAYVLSSTGEIWTYRTKPKELFKAERMYLTSLLRTETVDLTHQMKL